MEGVVVVSHTCQQNWMMARSPRGLPRLRRTTSSCPHIHSTIAGARASAPIMRREKRARIREGHLSDAEKEDCVLIIGLVYGARRKPGWGTLVHL